MREQDLGLAAWIACFWSRPQVHELAPGHPVCAHEDTSIPCVSTHPSRMGSRHAPGRRPGSARPPTVTERFFASSSAECFASKVFLFVHGNDADILALSSRGSESAIARAAYDRNPSPTATVSIFNGCDRSVAGRISVGLPDFKIVSSTYARSYDSGTGMMQRSRRRA